MFLIYLYLFIFSRMHFISFITQTIRLNEMNKYDDNDDDNNNNNNEYYVIQGSLYRFETLIYYIIC
jgi:hypothetical protein